MAKYAFLLMMSICWHYATAQKSITPDDFRLCLDDFGCSDSILNITKRQLLNAKKLTANFSWFTITALTFYFSSEFGTDVTIQTCESNEFCDKLKPLLERCSTGAVLTITAVGVNRSGIKIHWGDISIKVLDTTD